MLIEHCTRFALAPFFSIEGIAIPSNEPRTDRFRME